LPRWLALPLAAFLLAAPLASHGQAPDAGAPAPHVRTVRPPEGSLRRGALPVPEWVAIAAGATLAIAAAGALLLRSRSSRRR
jgi:hypothetical protein